MFKESVIETIKKRQSNRTFEDKAILELHQNRIQRYLKDQNNLIGPFGGVGRIEWVPVTNNTTDKGLKVGTYGFIKNPRAYLVGITDNNQSSLLDFAYSFHKLILSLTELGIGTCWMGGTFNRHSFEQELQLADGEFIPCVTPIGYPKSKQRVFDIAVRYVIKADNKKSWDKLFYIEDLNHTLSEDTAGLLAIPIEMVRLGPSASNKQPWRLVLSADGKVCHFYIEHTPNYSSKLGYDMQLLDIGIAMCQFELSCQELKIKGQWVRKDPNIKLPNVNYEYMITWVVN